MYVTMEPQKERIRITQDGLKLLSVPNHLTSICHVLWYCNFKESLCFFIKKFEARIKAKKVLASLNHNLFSVNKKTHRLCYLKDSDVELLDDIFQGPPQSRDRDGYLGRSRRQSDHVSTLRNE
jgi:hypothetical protein